MKKIRYFIKKSMINPIIMIGHDYAEDEINQTFELPEVYQIEKRH
jgi:hypothetical protein